MENNGLDKITAKIIEEPQLEADKIIEQAETDKARVLAEYRIKADEITAKYKEKAEGAKALGDRKAKSFVESAERNAILDAKSALLDGVFENAEKKILSLDEKSYFAFLSKLLCSTVDERISAEKQSNSNGDEICVTDEFVVKMNKNDSRKFGKKLSDFVKKTYPDIKVKFDDSPCDIDGGLIVICDKLEVNCSVSLLLKSQRDSLEREAADMLFGNR